MLKKVTIKNFKVIRELTIEFTPLTVLIGENSCGKSTVLQALDFLCSIVSRDIDEYLKDREWDFDEIKSQFLGKDKPVSFKSEFEIYGMEITWEIKIDYADGKWDIQERFVDSKKVIHDFHLEIKSSILKILEVLLSKHSDIPPELHGLKKFLTYSTSFELLSPDRMRSNSRGKADHIGVGGEKLAAYIHGLPLDRKNELNEMVSEFIGYSVEIRTAIQTSSVVEMFLMESAGEFFSGVAYLQINYETAVKKRHISDGLLRIIAFSAILVSRPKGLVLLDEIEDGINPAFAEKLLGCFKKAAEENKSQFVVTSHSPVMVNYADAEDIQYMWRDDLEIHIRRLFETPEMKETLEFLNPGEVWLNYSKEEIIKKLTGGKEGRDD